MKKPFHIFAALMGVVLGATALLGVPKTAMASQDELGVTALESNITSMNLKGYVGNSIRNNIKRWQLEAYHENQNIIDQIAWANSGIFGLNAVLGTDWFGVDGYYDIGVSPHGGNKALSWTLKSVPASFGDRDMRFAHDGSAVTDWTGATELWLKIDASEIASAESMRVAFEENVVGRESYSVKNGATVYTVTGGQKTQTTAASGGYVNLPAGFDGYLVLPLNGDTFERYYELGGNNVLDLGAVVQFQLALKGGAGAVGKTVYVDEFAIVGAVNGDPLPLATQTGETYRRVWDFESLDTTTGTDNSSLFWYGEFVGKLLTGMAYSYKISPSPELKAAMEEIITDLKAAQGEDGYLGVFVGGARYSISVGNWDLWNHYHVITGLLEWHKQTGSPDALAVARKAIDCIYETFRNRSYLVVGGFETNRGIAHGYAQMYQTTGERKYLDEAERIILQDCQDDTGWYKTAKAGGHFFQSSSNRWEVLHMIMTLGILYEETGKQEYYDVMSKIWYDILEYDIHNGGGFTTNESALGNPYLEGVIETCCSIAWAAYSNEFYKYAKTVQVADELERTYYNAILGSLLDTDRVCTYNTPMNGVVGRSGTYDGRRVSSQQDISFQYNAGSPDMNCCQANLARGLGQLSEWAAVTDGSDLYLNYYGNSEITTTVASTTVTLSQVTSYPVDGKVMLTVSGLAQESAFALKLRIPSWGYGSTVTVDGVKQTAKEGEYFTVDRVWKNGDRIQISLAQSFTYWTGEQQQRGYTSVFYGPILLTLDEYFAPECSQATAFDVLSFESATVASGSAQDCMLTVTVASGGRQVTLVDFASAGKYRGKSVPSTYWSWLTVTDPPAATSDLAKQWMNSGKKRVAFGASAVSSRFAYYPGETVSFTVSVPAGKQVDRVVAGAQELTAQDGKYSFVMPRSEVEVAVTFVDKTPIRQPQENEQDEFPWWIVGVAGALVVAGGAAGLAMRKKKQ